MIREVIWTSGAEGDFLGTRGDLADPSDFTKALDVALELLKLLPERGPVIAGYGRSRRILVGRSRQYGLYYSIVGERLIVLALVDLRRAPERIVEILKSRGIEG